MKLTGGIGGWGGERLGGVHGSLVGYVKQLRVIKLNIPCRFELFNCPVNGTSRGYTKVDVIP